MKQKTTRILFSLLLLLMLNGCGYAGPEKAVRQELELIKKLDDTTVETFLTYESSHLTGSDTAEITEEATEAVKLFFQDFKYRIRSSSVSDDETSASVVVDITNLDARALAKDLCRLMISRSTFLESREDFRNSLAFSFALMKECLESHTYEQVTSSVTVPLTRQDDLWQVQNTAELQDQLAGGLASSLADPYLLAPEEVLDIRLAPFCDFTGEDWISYLNIHDIFHLGTDLSSQIDAALAEQIASYFNYEILSSTQDQDTAAVTVRITSLDLESVISQCRMSLLDYAGTTESIRATDEELNQKTSEILLNALVSNQSSGEKEVSITMINNGYTWETALNDSFADALLGGISEAIGQLAATD